MALVKEHTSIFRFDKFEHPVTIELDDGTLIDKILFFDKKPGQNDIEDAVNFVISRYEAMQSEEPKEILVAIEDIERVLKAKGLMNYDEKWEDWKNTNIEAVK